MNRDYWIYQERIVETPFSLHIWIESTCEKEQPYDVTIAVYSEILEGNTKVFEDVRFNRAWKYAAKVAGCIASAGGDITIKDIEQLEANFADAFADFDEQKSKARKKYFATKKEKGF